MNVEGLTRENVASHLQVLLQQNTLLLPPADWKACTKTSLVNSMVQLQPM